MAAEVTWTRSALDDVNEIGAYIAQDSPAYSGLVVAAIMSAGESLRTLSRRGQVVQEWGQEDVRQLIVYSYRLIYHVDGHRVLILAVIHGARLLPPDPPNRAA